MVALLLDKNCCVAPEAKLLQPLRDFVYYLFSRIAMIRNVRPLKVRSGGL
jgi:hypothetical protein